MPNPLANCLSIWRRVSIDSEARTLIRIARLAVKRKFKGRILAGHCCALALQTDEFITDTMDACKDAGIDIVSLPAVNLYLQARGPFGSNTPRQTPRWRGVTLLHELERQDAVQVEVPTAAHATGHDDRRFLREWCR